MHLGISLKAFSCIKVVCKAHSLLKEDIESYNSIKPVLFVSAPLPALKYCSGQILSLL